MKGRVTVDRIRYDRSHNRKTLGKRILRHWELYLFLVPALVYIIVMNYGPMYGVLIAFQDYKPRKGMSGSEWVGLKHFIRLFGMANFGTYMKNTLILSFYSLLAGFPLPIVLALAMNSSRHRGFAKVVQTATYAPHFISMVVICGLLVDFCSSTGIITSITTLFGAQRDNLLNRPELFRTIYVSSDIWQSIGWGSIIYLATLSSTDPSLYEAAAIDGAGRFQQVIHVTLPTLVPLIMLQLIMRMGQMMNVGYEKIILLSNGLTYDTADVISSYVYRRGLQTGDFSFGVAVSLFNSACNIVLLVLANTLSGKLTHESMW